MNCIRDASRDHAESRSVLIAVEDGAGSISSCQLRVMDVGTRFAAWMRTRHMLAGTADPCARHAVAAHSQGFRWPAAEVALGACVWHVPTREPR